MSRLSINAGDLPACRLGYVQPLDVIDTFAYEFYRLASPNSIATTVSIGLRGFSDSAAAAAIDANLERCLTELVKREVQFITVGGLPMLFNLSPDFSREFARRCAEERGVRAGTSIDAALAAFSSLQVKNVVVLNKWDERLNGRVASTLQGEGVNLVGAVAEEHSVTEIQAKFETGVDVALRLAEKAVTRHPEADCLFIAGSAWLVAPFITQIEKEFGVAVVAGQQSKIWYSLNMVGNHADRPEYGRLMATPMAKDGDDVDLFQAT